MGAGIGSVFGWQASAIGGAVGGTAALADYAYSHPHAPTQQQQDFQKMLINWAWIMHKWAVVSPSAILISKLEPLKFTSAVIEHRNGAAYLLRMMSRMMFV